MNNPSTLRSLERPSSGVAMDRTLPRARYGSWLRRMLVASVMGVAVLGVWLTLPRGLPVKTADLQVGTVTAGQFRDEILFRAAATPFESVMLDATEGGRVEAIQVRDGAIVKQGDLLFRLSNPQREQEVLARSADVAQQIANIATLRAALATARSEHHRRISDLEFQVDRTRKNNERNERLARQGFLSEAALEESRDMTAQQERLLAQARADAATEDATRQRAIAEMDRAVAGLNQGLALVRTTMNGLVVRAPTDGRLTDFHLDVGTSVKPGDRLGRLDTPGRYKLVAQVDEFYLGRVAPGLIGTADIDGRSVALVVTRVNSQVKERRFEMELDFSGPMPAQLQPGQTIDTRVVLGKPSEALLLPDGAFFADTGGAWVFVLSPDGKSAERRKVKLGRRGAGQIEVLGGLEASDRVIVSGYAGFGEAQQLRIEH